MEKELYIISAVLQWLDNCSITLESLRQKNVEGASQICYSSLGNCITTKGCLEMADEYWKCRNLRYGHFLNQKPSKLSCHFTYYLDNNRKLLCAVKTYKEAGAYVTNEDHHLIDWDEHTIVYGFTFKQQPIDHCTNYTIYMFDDERVYAKALISYSYIWLTYFFYTDTGEIKKLYQYSFYKRTSKKPIPEHQIKMINGSAYTYNYTERW